MAAIVFAHLGAALKHHFIDRDDVLARMLPLLRNSNGGAK
jgi:cytochrome b561